MPHLTIATCVHAQEYSQEPDDALLLTALHQQGINTDLVAWDDPDYDWSRPDLVVVRSTWDYPTRPAAFLAWVEGVSRLTTLWNPVELVRWNMQKTYLLDLHLRGVPIIPTLWLPAHSPVRLFTLMHAHGWSQVVVKPVIGTSSRETLVVSSHTREEGETHLSRLLSREAVMVQPFLPTFYSAGERSLIFLAGQFTHAIRKRFSLLDGLDQAGQQPIPASEEEVAFAKALLGRLPCVPLYARVDLVRDHRHALVLNELEVIEPVLYLSHSREALQRLTQTTCHLARQAERARQDSVRRPSLVLIPTRSPLSPVVATPAQEQRPLSATPR